MTGEITLRGRVLPIGGLKEKLIAAHRGGIDTVLIPKENEKDLKEIPAQIKRGASRSCRSSTWTRCSPGPSPSTTPQAFLREGDHVVDSIFEGHRTDVAETLVPPAGVN